MTQRQKAPVLVMVLKGYPRLSETFISNEIELLESLGLRVRIVSMRDPREAARHASVYRIKADVVYLPDRILPALGELLYENLRAAADAPAGYARAVWRMLGQLVRTRRSATLKHLLQAGFLCRRALGPHEAVHLHAHFAHSPTSVALYAGLMRGLPVSFTGHAKDVWTQPPRKLAAKIGQAAFVVTCTKANAAYLRQLAPNGTPVYAVYHGIDLRLFDGDRADAPAGPPWRVLTVARLTAKKGLDTVLCALGELARQGFDFRYDLVGEGEDRPALLAQARALGLADRVTFHGALPHEAVLGLYRQAHVFALGCRVLPNGDRDGVPNVLVEAMAMGVPVAATNVSALPELARDGETALTCPPDDPAALATAIRRLAEDAPLRERLVRAGKAAVARDFDNAANTQALADIFRRDAGAPAGSFAAARQGAP
ncbi:MAG: glycosyltransferase family 4 protein [Solidesulfovibrio sp. DCME]|uniref:glycosyltransferase family 4 protein n=1 Tax=Solidesulfovibrio sp. DCME TaxID=3447380 RepID=UPI003D0C7B58